jgi:antitoxin MazE5
MNKRMSSASTIDRVFGWWHTYGMARIRVSTTVSEELISRARALRSDLNDAALLDAALADLISRHRTAEIDKSYDRYSEQPLNDGDEWGDLESFLDAAKAES